MLTHECKGNASYKHLSIKQENIDLYYKNKPRIFATVPTYPYSQAYLINEIANGKIACCRLGSDRSHAVVLLGVDADAGKFIYYDPVLGGENNKAAFTEIYDPRIITKK